MFVPVSVSDTRNENKQKRFHPMFQETTVQVDKKDRDGWKLKRKFGDVQAIADESGISVATIRKCLNKGEGNPDTIAAVKKFYSKRKAA
jgi:hypothetical protein